MQRAWTSPTLTTWASLGVRTFSFAIILPLVLTRFSPDEITIWYLLNSIAGLQVLADVGFLHNFSRLVAYAMSGSRDFTSFADNERSIACAEPNWELLERIYATMHHIYARLSLIAVLALGLAGCIAMTGPAARLPSQLPAWSSLAVFLLTTVIGLRGNCYAAFLVGSNQVSLVRRWEAIFAAFSILCGLGALLMGGKVLAFTIANQVWVVVGVLRNRWLVRVWQNGRFARPSSTLEDRAIAKVAWSASWRLAIATIMSHGLTQLSGLLAAQNKNPTISASYLFGLSLIRNISFFSQAPFYTKLPLLAKLTAGRQPQTLMKHVVRSIRLSYFAYIAPFLLIGIAGPAALTLIHSKTSFPSIHLWYAFGMAFLLERYGAMHIHLCALHNRILFHIANGVGGILTILIALALFPKIGVIAFPISMIASSVLFYGWYCSISSHREFGFSWPYFDCKIGAIPSFIVVIATYPILIYFNKQ